MIVDQNKRLVCGGPATIYPYPEACHDANLMGNGCTVRFVRVTVTPPEVLADLANRKWRAKAAGA